MVFSICIESGFLDEVERIKYFSKMVDETVPVKHFKGVMMNHQERSRLQDVVQSKYVEMQLQVCGLFLSCNTSK